jgi:hypothetical protein
MCCVVMSLIFALFDNSIGTRISPAWLSTALLAAVVACYNLKFKFYESSNNK